MLPNFTPCRFFKKTKSGILALIAGLGLSTAVSSQVLINESFNTAIPLPTGWAQQNLSNPAGTSAWFQGNNSVFPANSGAPTAYIGANFNSTSGAGTISNWLFTPAITVKNGDQLTFFTRKVTPAPTDFPDRMQVRLSTNGSSTNVGASDASVGDFTTLLLDINPTLVAGQYPTTWTQFTVNITGVPAPVTGRIAFRYFVTDGGPSGNNSDYIGLDDVVYTAFTGPCAGAPAPGNTVSSAATVCDGIGFTLSMSTPPTTSGITYQWQSAPASTGPWTNIAGATSVTLNRTQTASTWYRCNVTCNVGSTTATTPLEVPMSPSTSCYCIPPISNCNLADLITNVTIEGLNNTSTCSANGYGNFTSSVAPGTLYIGANNPMRVTVGNGGTEHVGVWVDYDKNGSFDATEFTALGSGNGVTISNFINVPAGASSGITRMRVRVRWNTPLTSGNACTAYTFGETEDYAVNLSPCIVGSFVTQPANASTACGSNVSFSVTTAGSLLTYQWQEKVSAAAAWTNVSNGGVYSGATAATLTLTNVPATMNSYQYRVIISGGCTSPNFSNAGTLTVTPLIATTNVSSATICTGSVQQLTLTNASSPTTVSFTNNTVLAIPDGVAAGVTSSIAVSGIPSGAVISDVTVVLNNLTHSFVGDLDINLIAPNGQNINLVGGLDNGGGLNGSDNFIGTAISSNGTTPLSGAPAPRTGTFAADRRAGYGPTGNTQTTNVWSNLYGTMNGTWRLALADFFSIDAGSLNSWTIRITYGAPTTGVWTANPATPNTMFTDAAATIAYTPGSQATTVYVKPTVNTSYSVVYVSGTPCTTPPTTIPVSVSNPVSNITHPASAATCINGGASFTVSASGNPLTYQWQISTDAGLTWTNITGATSSTFAVSGVTLSMNGNRYRCIITAAPCGSVTSNAAILTVNQLPVVNATANRVALVPGTTATLTATGPTGSTFSWLRNGAPAGTGSSITVNVDQVGSYRAVVNVAGCSNTSNEVVITSQESDKLWIYPNPNSNGVVTVRLFDNSGVAGDVRTISVYDLAGRKVSSQEYIMVQNYGAYQPMVLNLPKLPNGLYSVRVHEKHSGKVTTGKLVIGR